MTSSTTIKVKPTCGTCVAALNGRCPLVVQLSLVCPKEPGKPLLSKIKQNKKTIALQLFTVELN